MNDDTDVGESFHGRWSSEPIHENGQVEEGNDDDDEPMVEDGDDDEVAQGAEEVAQRQENQIFWQCWPFVAAWREQEVTLIQNRLADWIWWKNAVWHPVAIPL